MTQGRFDNIYMLYKLLSLKHFLCDCVKEPIQCNSLVTLRKGAIAETVMKALLNLALQTLYTIVNLYGTWFVNVNIGYRTLVL